MSNKRSRQLAIQAARSESRFLHQWILALKQFRLQLEMLGDRNPMHRDDVQFAIRELDIEIAELGEEEYYWTCELNARLFDDADHKRV